MNNEKLKRLRDGASAIREHPGPAVPRVLAGQIIDLCNEVDTLYGHLNDIYSMANKSDFGPLPDIRELIDGIFKDLNAGESE